jgi:hypothetical protein
LFKRAFSILLLVTFVTTSLGVRFVLAQQGADAETAKLRSKVEALGITRVEVKLRDRTKLKGHISGTDQHSFVITNLAGGNTKIFYADVAEVKKASAGWSTRNWIILGSVVASALVTWAIVKSALCDGGAQTRGPC